jgi:hypothetical protein
MTMTWNQVNGPVWDHDLSQWMSQLDDDLLIRDLSIPGTHDSAALRGFAHFDMSVTQDW